MKKQDDNQRSRQNCQALFRGIGLSGMPLTENCKCIMAGSIFCNAICLLVSRLLESKYKRLMEFGQGNKSMEPYICECLQTDERRYMKKNIVVIGLQRSDTLQSELVVEEVRSAWEGELNHMLASAANNRVSVHKARHRFYPCTKQGARHIVGIPQLLLNLNNSSYFCYTIF